MAIDLTIKTILSIDTDPHPNGGFCKIWPAFSDEKC